jgi:hypothetical protein
MKHIFIDTIPYQMILVARRTRGFTDFIDDWTGGITNLHISRATLPWVLRAEENSRRQVDHESFGYRI